MAASSKNLISCRTYLQTHSHLGPSHPDILSSKRALADILIQERECSEAETILREVHPVISDQYGKNSSHAISCYSDLIRSVECQFRYDEVTRMLSEARMLVNGMERSWDVMLIKRKEREKLDKIESDMKAYQADVEERFEFMRKNRGLLRYDAKKGR